jgi:hypothetical protein
MSMRTLTFAPFSVYVGFGQKATYGRASFSPRHRNKLSTQIAGNAQPSRIDSDWVVAPRLAGDPAGLPRRLW